MKTFGVGYLVFFFYILTFFNTVSKLILYAFKLVSGIIDFGAALSSFVFCRFVFFKCRTQLFLRHAKLCGYPYLCFEYDRADNCRRAGSSQQRAGQNKTVEHNGNSHDNG